MMVTASAVNTNRLVPSVFTRSGSSTPWTWTFVLVKVTTEGAAAVVRAAPKTTLATPPKKTGVPPNQDPYLLYTWALFAFAAMNSCS